MHVTTFYSYKGGVGRTLACANFGLYLAKTGQKVVLVDMDFEAPGLDSKFQSVDVTGIGEGMLDQFFSYQEGKELPELKGIDIHLPDDVIRSGGRLHLIPAGNYLDQNYYRMLSGLQWDVFLKEEKGLAFCLDIVKRIEKSFGADVLVIDSRTGLTELGGLCTQIFPDTVLLFTCTSPESMAGTRRIYTRINESPIIKKRLRERNRVEVKIVISRIPRPENLPELDSTMKKRLGMAIDRLYYVFDQSDLSFEEYLALDRFADRPPAILGDYVELFASLHPENTMPYIEERLKNFCMKVTRRTPTENERLIQELLTLFPQPDVWLEAARYYRLVKDGESKSITQYIHYLDQHPSDRQVLEEFVNICETMPSNQLKPKEKVLNHLRNYGAEPMNKDQLERYLSFSESEEDWRNIIKAIEADPSKLQSSGFREIYLETLHNLKEWEKIINTASENEIRTFSLGLIVAEAYASMNKIPETIGILNKLDIPGLDEFLSIMRLFYKFMPDIKPNKIVGKFLTDHELDIQDIEKSALFRLQDRDFVRWFEQIMPIK